LQVWGTKLRRYPAGAGSICLTAAAFSCSAWATPALPQSLQPISILLQQYGGLAGITLGLALCFAIIKITRLTAAERDARLRVADLEVLLNETEAAGKAEAHVLLTWRGNEAMPDRKSGTMHGIVKMPTELNGIMAFNRWLEPDSVELLQASLRNLRQAGTPFNVGIKTIEGDLLEADGRVAGSLAALRFRPLAGERRQVSELSYDARKLAKQVERLSAVLDSAPFPVWIRDEDGGLQWVNQAYVKSTDIPDIDTVLRINAELVKRDAIDTTKEDAANGLTGRAHTVLHGEMRALDVYETTFEKGRAGFAIDVTEIETAEKELERHIKAHASTLDKLDTAIAIFGPDQKLRFFNNAFCTLWTLDAKWLETHPMDGEILDLLRTRRALPEQVNYREWKAKHLSAYTTLDVREDFWYLPDGRSVRVICEQHPFGGVTYLYENLTKELLLESRFNELAGVQRETLDNLAEAVSLFGSDGKLMLSNPAFAKFWNIEPGILPQEPHIDELANHKTLEPDAMAAWQNIRFGITSIEANRKIVEGKLTQDGHIFRYRAVPLPDGNALLTLTDISDASRAEQALRDRTEALEAADRLKNSFLANVSYEIRTPLTSIVGFSEALEIGLAGPLTPKQQDYIFDIKRSSEDLKSILDAIIDLSAVDAGAMELRTQQVDVVGILESVVEKFAPALERRKLGLTVEVGSDVTEIAADPARIEQIVGHLLSNAIGFSPANSTIKVGARKKDGFVQLWVADTGRGIEPEFQSKVFERFQSRPLAGSHRGAGLGLAIVKSFTELHGGKVSLVSKIDHGTTVVCSLPINGPRRPAVEPRSKSKSSQAA
jgi:signal transduction histidine kinase